jgi:GrpB-like predicted nucleotidyltransferase (UPF0157 family)
VSNTRHPGFTAHLSDYASRPRYRCVAQAERPGPSLRAYDARWPRIFASERLRIQAALGSLAIAVEHVGSSSVPGLWGRPEIDILVGVADGADVDESTRRLASAGYVTQDRAEPGSEPWSLLAKRGPTLFELLVLEHGGALWSRHLGLRDHLRADPVRALEYGRLKSRWAARYGVDTPGYKQAKRRFWASVRLQAPC